MCTSKMQCAAGCTTPATGEHQIIENVRRLGDFNVAKIHFLCDRCSIKLATDAGARAVLEDIKSSGNHG